MLACVKSQHWPALRHEPRRCRPARGRSRGCVSSHSLSAKHLQTVTCKVDSLRQRLRQEHIPFIKNVFALLTDKLPARPINPARSQTENCLFCLKIASPESMLFGLLTAAVPPRRTGVRAVSILSLYAAQGTSVASSGNSRNPARGCAPPRAAGAKQKARFLLCDPHTEPTGEV